MPSPQAPPPLPDTRRIITTHNASRSATIAINEHKEPTALEDGTYLNPLWSSDELPATIDQDPTKIQPDPTAATTGGSVFCTYDLPPKRGADASLHHPRLYHRHPRRGHAEHGRWVHGDAAAGRHGRAEGHHAQVGESVG
ncbi:hypothetical protein AnigIFM62618_002028 [Aspergillus niger]|nr:hypothetical protein AnigIFM62618_002028 [Aspergillus niger]